LQRVRQSKKTGKLTYDVVFGITSLSSQTCSPQRLMHIIRDHWHIENRLHHVREPSMKMLVKSASPSASAFWPV
jgi:predicted transposase YbfD/YdcC